MKNKTLLKNFQQLLGFGNSKLQSQKLNIRQVRFKKNILFMNMCAVQSYSEGILRLVGTKPIYDKAALVLFRSLTEALINLNFIYTGRSQKNAFIFITSSYSDRINFAKKYHIFWDKYPTWKLEFESIKKPCDWDEYIFGKLYETLHISKKSKHPVPKKLLSLVDRAIVYDTNLKHKGKLSEKISLEKYYVVYYQYLSQFAHLIIDGLDKFVSFDKNNIASPKIYGDWKEMNEVISLTYVIYFVVLRFFLKQFKLFNKSEFKIFENFSKSMI